MYHTPYQIEAIKNMKPPENVRELKAFIGIVNHSKIVLARI